jgi:hypothetical protein
MTKWILLVAASLLIQDQVFADSPFVRIGNCSGVVISPSGLILTAEHCGCPARAIVVFAGGQKREAILRYRPPQNGIDEVAVYHLTGGGEYSFAKVAREEVDKGDPVSSHGYPSGKYKVETGEVLEVGFTARKDGLADLKLSNGMVTNWKSEDGSSGSALLNANGEVAGILSMSNSWPQSYWIGLDEIHKSIEATQFPTRQRRLVMFSLPGDKDCILYEKEIEATRNGILVLRADDPSFPDWKASYESHTGVKLDRFPTFWAEGTSNTKSAKYQPGFLGSLLSWFRGIIHALFGGLFGQDESVPAPVVYQQPGSSDAPPVPIEELDSSNITVIVLAKRQDVGIAKGTAIKIAISKIAGPLERKISEIVGSKARVVLVPERTLPDRFAAISQAAGTEADPAAVFVLVRQQSLGLKTLIAGKVERAIQDKIPDNVPVELIFERQDSDSFNRIMEATYAGEIPEPEVIIKSGDPIPAGEPPVSNGVIATILAAMSSAWGAKEGIKAFRNSRAAKIAIAVAGKVHGKKEEPEAEPKE